MSSQIFILSLTGHSPLFFLLLLFFFSIFLSFCLSSFSVLLFVLLQSKISPTLKDKRISALLIHSLSSPICLSFFVLHPSQADPFDEQHLNATRSRLFELRRRHDWTRMVVVGSVSLIVNPKHPISK